MNEPVVVVSRMEDLGGPAPAHVHVVTAEAYLAAREPRLRAAGTRVVNLSRTTRYLSRGYYVSLVADARGQTVEPGVDALRGLLDPDVRVRALHEAQLPVASDAERAPEERALVLLGRTQDPRFRTLARRVHEVWPHPLLMLHLVREQRVWRLLDVRTVTLSDLSPDDLGRLRQALAAQRTAPASPATSGFRLAVLFDPDDPHRPSDAPTIDRLARVAARQGVSVQRIGPEDLGRVGEFDALWIRTLTGTQEPSFRFARRAEALGMPVLDDTRSILRCGSKVWLHEQLSRHGVAMPTTVLVDPSTRYEDVVAAIGTPFVLKRPDGSFSKGVVRIDGAPGFGLHATAWLRASPLLVAQAWMPTAFDWRVTVLDGRPLFVCRYHMARGHWQIAKSTAARTTFGKVEAVPRAEADADVVEVACRAARLIGDGLYGVDLKDGPSGPVILEVNDNPNLDTGYDDAADGGVIYEDLIAWYRRRLARLAPGAVAPVRRPPAEALRAPIRARTALSPPWGAFEVVGLEIEVAVVDRNLDPVPRVEDVLRAFAGRPASDAVLGDVGLSNEIVDHVLEFKTLRPLPSLVETESVLAEAIRRVGAWLEEAHGARLLPTGMHPWLDPAQTRLWARSGRRVYDTYARLFDLKQHGWANVQAVHVNLPMGSDTEAVALMNAAALLVPYLPAISASSPMAGGALLDQVDGRLDALIGHQARLPESTGAMVPEYVTSLGQWRRDVIQPMYAALDRLPDAGALRHEFLNARAAVFKPSRRALEVRILDVQECVRMDCAVAAFVRGGLRWLATAVQEGMPLPPHAALVRDLHRVRRAGTAAEVEAPHLIPGGGSVRDALRVVLDGARAETPTDEQGYLDLVEAVIERGSLSERIATFLRPHAQEPAALRRAARRVYEDLATCLVDDRPWAGRDLPRITGP